MIPSFVNIDAVVASLSDAQIFIDPNFPRANSISENEMQRIIKDVQSGASKEKYGEVKVALLGRALSPTGMRDVAQRIKDELGANTVIVKSPGGGATVADNFSRYNLESNTHLMYKGSTTEGLQSYMAAIGEHRDPDMAVNAVGLTSVILGIAITATATRLTMKRGMKHS
ncbi:MULTISPECIES: DUF6676 family protein [Corynebacterium]|uniref:Uncharacterized protein n=1 Tax=Corynebacterium auriscanis TaxID=99807 RepID=A0A0A2DN18_9CORY|nr:MULTISPECIES: DUF6676 family protein [Corynebacterium]KGM19314.1 hypothetical protein MA47_01690 [Corynebacterium auriscanis]OFT91514.1 hypothetical protein HMPREF3098_00725 [Corynebacterium sp. HMSC28B08]WJY72700.1 hypothetical protein CAURIC_05320 [Corynebacterium auriscanis]